MDELIMENRTKGSVWGVAAVAVAIFVVAVILVGIFGNPEIATVAAAN
ncbi:MAG: hypothetical protein R3D34_12510 [Nitratireductor sp.]